MTERLPNNGETGWGDILGANDGTGGFLRVAHNDDGTQILPGGSFLVADAVAVNGIAHAASENMQWLLNDSAGSDVAIDGGDNTKITFAETGLYYVICNYQCGPTTTGPLTELLYGIAPNGGSIANDVTWLGNDGSGGLLAMTNSWLLSFTAGDFVQFFATLRVTPDTWHIQAGDANLMIARLA